MARRMLNLERVTQIASMLDSEERVDVLKKTIVELLDAYAKTNRRLEKITKLSDRQQVRVINLNESLEAANTELDTYKNDLEQKVNEETYQQQQFHQPHKKHVRHRALKLNQQTKPNHQHTLS